MRCGRARLWSRWSGSRHALGCRRPGCRRSWILPASASHGACDTRCTTKERPAERFEGERHLLRPLAEHPGRSLVLPAPPPLVVIAGAAPERVEVERRSLGSYAQLAGAA